MPLNNDLIYTVADRNKTEKQKASNPKRKHTSQNGKLIAKTRKYTTRKQEHNFRNGINTSPKRERHKKPKTVTVTDQN